MFCAPLNIQSRRLLNRRLSGSLLAFIRVIRGLNVFGGYEPKPIS